MSQSRKGYSWQLGLASSLAICGAIASHEADLAFAQSVIIPDSTLGSESSRVEPNSFDGSTEVLTGGAIRGNNLFHSFQELNVIEGREAFFLSPSSNIQNIITRVTGSNRSEILGTLGTFQMIDGIPDSSNANLFLINPNGIIFGPNATLRLGGSFVASTTSGIKFADGTQFSATAPQTTPLLTVSVPLGLQFGGTAGDILVQGALEVEAGKTLALVGGNVNLDKGLLLAPNGQIALGGILGAGTIGLNLDSNSQPLSFPNNVALANVSLRNGTQIAPNPQENQNSRGIIAIWAKQLTIKDGSQVTASTFGTGSAGNLTVNASDSVQVIGTDADGNPSGLFTDTFSTGAAGTLTINTGKLIIQDGANVSATSRMDSQGAAGGTLKVNASNLVQLSGTSAKGNPSGLFAVTQGTEQAGSLTIDTNSLIVQNGAQVGASAGIGSRGNGGTLTVRASDSVKLSGTGPNDQLTGLFVRSRGTGDAGSLTITTGQLIVRDGARVSVESLGSGNAGNLQIQARDLRLDGGQLTAETASGLGGNITLQNLDLLLLRRNSQITTNADTSLVGADVAGGNINIDSKLIVAVPEEDSDITANAFRGRGGNINITTQGIFGIQPRQSPTSLSDITASSEFGVDGNVELNTPEIDPNTGLINLLTVPVDTELAQGCDTPNYAQSSFVITGRGGLPTNPRDVLTNDAVYVDWVTLKPSARNRKSSSVTTKPITATPKPIIEATGWVINEKKEVILTANAPNATSDSLGFTRVKCHASENRN